MPAGFICQSQLKSCFSLLLSLSLSLCSFWFGLSFHLGITCFCSNPNTAQSWLSATGLQDCPLSLLTATLTLDLFSSSPSVWGIAWTLPLSCVNESGDKWEWSWPRQPVCVCVCEDLAIILHAWCLYLAGPSPSLSLPLFLSLSPYVDVSAYPGLCLHTLSLSRSFVFWFHSAPCLCLCTLLFVCVLQPETDTATYGARWAQIHLVAFMAALSRHRFVIRLSWLV